ILAGTAVACLLWTGTSLFALWPHGMCYVNPLWGGTEDGYRLVSEGNYDWGQGYQELAGWLDEHPQKDLDGWLFTTDPRAGHAPLRRLDPHNSPIETADDFLA